MKNPSQKYHELFKENELLKQRIQDLEISELELKKSVEALKESESRMRSIFRAAPIGIGLVSNRVLMDVNERFCEISGYSRDELIGKNSRILYPTDEDYEFVGREKYKQINEGGIGTVETRIKRKDGEILNIIMSSTPLDITDLSVGVTFTALDITARKRAEEALVESEKKYKSLADSLPQVVFETDIEGNLIYVNRVSFDLFGYTQQDFDQGLNALQMLIPEDRKRSIEDIGHTLRGVTLGGQEYTALRKDGKTFPVIIHSSCIISDGKAVGLRGIIVDLSTLKQTEDALRESEARLRSILDSVQAGIIIIDVKTHEIIDVNSAAVEMIGASKENIIGSVCHKYICPAEVGKCPITDLGQKIDHSERLLLKGSSEGIPVLKTVSSMIINGKEHLLESFIDITDRKRLESQLQQAQKMEAIGTLAGGIAHDFNNILSPIMIHSEMAMMEVGTDSPIQQHLRNIYIACERARNLVKQILTFARKREEEKAAIRISPILKETVNFLRSTIPSTINIRYNFNAEHDTVLADPTQINQIVMNLCTNSAHAMRGKEGILEINLVDEYIDSNGIKQFAGLDAGHYLRLSVIDTGCGIPSHIIDKVFEPYFTTKEPGEGTGMGLAVVHGIIKNHGGYIGIESEVGTGTTFFVLLPIYKTKVSMPTEVKMGIPRGKEHILVVDDEKMITDIIQSVLENLGYTVTARTSSIEALEAFRNNPDRYDLVITDMTMPNMTGKDLAKELLTIQPNIPIILCTGFSEQIDETRAKEIGIKAFVMKPVVMHDIANIIRDVLINKK